MSTAWPGQPPELQLQIAVVRAVSDTLESSVANDTSGASASLMDQLAEELEHLTRCLRRDPNEQQRSGPCLASLSPA